MIGIHINVWPRKVGTIVVARTQVNGETARAFYLGNEALTTVVMSDGSPITARRWYWTPPGDTTETQLGTGANPTDVSAAPHGSSLWVEVTAGGETYLSQVLIDHFRPLFSSGDFMLFSSDGHMLGVTG